MHTFKLPPLFQGDCPYSDKGGSLSVWAVTCRDELEAGHAINVEVALVNYH